MSSSATPVRSAPVVPAGRPDRPRAHPPAGASALALARGVLALEAEAVAALGPRLDGAFLGAVDLLLACRGRVVVSGIGKSGHIARKLAATLASTGTPALFVHAAEAAHGDLGMVTRDDVVIALTYSGESAELMTIVPAIKREATPLIAMTGRADSTLARVADVHLDCHVAKEACPLNLAPTASTTAMLALGDALAVACLDARGFGAEDFARSHPGGALGRRLLTRVADVMRTGDAVPAVPRGATVMQAVTEISRKQMGMTAVVDGDRVVGIFTDGDLRKLLERLGDVRGTMIAEVMNPAPMAIGPQALAIEAAHLLDSRHRNQLLVVTDDGRLAGALHMQDLLSAKVL